MTERLSHTVLVVRSFIMKDGRVLALKRVQTNSHHPSLWEVPGGKLDRGQDLMSALKREIAEETGLQVRPISNLVYPISRIMCGGRYDGLTYVVLFGLSVVEGGRLKLSEEHNDYRWCTHAELMELELTPETRDAEIALENQLNIVGVR